MKNSRKPKGWLGAMLTAISLAWAGSAAAESYPSRPIKLVVPFTAGGSADSLARLVAQGMSRQLGQTIVVENRGGANTIIATSAVATAPADGYTLLLCTSALATNASLYKTPYDALTALTPISVLVSVPLLLVANPDLPIESVQDFLSYAKQHPRELSYSSWGMGSSAHLAGELLRLAVGEDMVHVPFKGSAPAMGEVIAGRIPIAFTTIPVSLPQIRAGKLRLLGVTSAKPLPQIQDAPLLKDVGLPDLVVEGWNGICAPSGIPVEIRDRIYQSIVATLSDPKTQERLTDEGYLPVGNSPEEFARDLEIEVPRWARVVKEANISVN